MKKVLLVLATLIATPAFAEDITVGVDGMVCAFCATGLEELFSDEPGVKSVKVDLEKSAVLLNAEDGKVSDSRIKEIVEKAGFTTNEIQHQN